MTCKPPKDGSIRVKPETMERFNQFMFALMAKRAVNRERVTQDDALDELLKKYGF